MISLAAAFILPAASFAAADAVVINEINYNAADRLDTGDWIELYNVTDSQIDISGWLFKDSNDSNMYAFPAGSVISANSYFLILRDSTEFLDKVKPASPYAGDFDFGLSRTGDQVRLFDSSGSLADMVEYGVGGDWPESPDGGGSTLSLRNPYLDNTSPLNWSQSIATGTPGAQNDVFAEDIIVINEINYNSPGQFNPEDWVELYNRFDLPVDMSGWIFKDDDNIFTYVFPAGSVIAPGEFFVVCRDTSLFREAFGNVEHVYGNFEFGLSGGGEHIYLYNSYGALVDKVAYNDVPPWPVDADGKGTTLSLVNHLFDNLHAENWMSSLGTGTPGAVNDVFSAGTIIINEINYNSFTLDSGDWVELHNSHDTAVDLSGWIMKDDNDANIYRFPEGASVGPRGYLVVCSNALKFFTVFPHVITYIGDIEFGLSNYGDSVRIYNAEGTLVDSLTYGITDPWPEGANGAGHTLELRHPTYDNALPENWADSAEFGTPGKRNSVYAWEPSSLDDYAIGQSYPNPFKQETLIPIYVPVETNVLIEVYSILGKRVAKPLDKRMSPGEHTIQFIPENLPSGIYIYRIKAGKFSESKTMVYTK